MNEEEIIKIMEELKENVRYKTIIPNEERNEWKREFDAIQGLLDLYTKQQKEIKELKKEKRILIEKYTEVVYECGKSNEEIKRLKNLNKNTYISKDKIREIIFEFIPNSSYEVILRTKLIKLLGE